MKRYSCVIFVALTFVLSGCGTEAKQDTLQKDPVMVAVQTKAESSFKQETIHYPGTVISDQEVRIVAKTGGTISQIAFSLGDVVTEGQVLATIDDIKENPVKTSYQNTLVAKNNLITTLANVEQVTNEQVEQATIAVEQARKGRELAQKNYDALRESSQKDIKQAEISKNQSQTGAKNVDITTTETYKTANISYETAKIAAEQARLNLEDRKILAKQAVSDIETNAQTAFDSLLNLCGTVFDSIKNSTDFDENSSSSIPYKGNLGVLNQQILIDAKNEYETAVEFYNAMRQKNLSSVQDKIDQVILLAQHTKTLVDKTKEVFENTITSASLPLSSSSGVSLSSLKTMIIGYQGQINSSLISINAIAQGLVNVPLNNTTLINSLEKTYELAKQQELTAQQNLHSLLAGNTSLKDQASFGMQSATNQFESVQIKIQAQLDTSKTQLDIAELQYKNALVALENAKKGKKSQLDATRTQLDSVTGQVELAKIQADNLSIVAPIKGTITKKLVSIGDTVVAGQSIAIASQTKKLKVQVYVDQDYVTSLRPSMAVTMADNNNKTFTGSVLNVSPQADTTTKRFLVEILPSEQEDSLPSPGVLVSVSFSLQQMPKISGAIFIPLSAIAIGQNTNSLYIVDHTTAKKVPVTIERVDGEFAEVKLDVSDETQIIIDGNKRLQEGDAVEVKSSK